MKALYRLIPYIIFGSIALRMLYKHMSRMRIASYTEEYLHKSKKFHATIIFKNKLRQTKTRNFLIEIKNDLAGSSFAEMIDVDTGEILNHTDSDLCREIAREGLKYTNRLASQKQIEEHYDSAITEDEKSWNDRFEKATSMPKYRVENISEPLDNEQDSAIVKHTNEKER